MNVFDVFDTMHPHFWGPAQGAPNALTKQHPALPRVLKDECGRVPGRKSYTRRVMAGLQCGDAGSVQEG